MSESEIQDAIRLALPASRVVLWRNNVGTARHLGRFVRYGLAPGSSDLVGILRGSGRFVALEVKTPKGKLHDEQKSWLRLVRDAGGFAAVVRSVQEAVDAIARAERGENE